MNTEIETLVCAAKQGNSEAFSRLYEMHYQAMYHYALHLCQNNYADAQEIVQEAFVSAFEHLDQLQKPEFFPLWIKKIVHSKCVRMFYRHKDMSIDPIELKSRAVEEQRVDFIPHENLSNETDQNILHSLMQELTEKQQEILEYFYFQQYSIKEIAGILQISRGTVKSRIFEARKALKKKVDVFEKKEQRKINFRLDPVVPSLLYLSAYYLSKTKVFQNDAILKSATVLATTSCTVFAIGASITTYHAFSEEATQNTSTPAMAIKPTIKEEPELIDFPTLQYEDKEIKTARAAYYTLMQKAPDQESMAQLSETEQAALLPLIEAIKNSDTNYRIVLERYE